MQSYPSGQLKRHWETHKEELRQLLSPQIAPDQNIGSEHAFDVAYRTLQREHGDIFESGITQRLTQFLNRIKKFVKVLALANSEAAQESSEAARELWTIIFLVLKTACEQKDKRKREQAIAYLEAYVHQLPAFDHPEEIYRANHLPIDVPLVALYNDVLCFHLELLRVTLTKTKLAFKIFIMKSSSASLEKTISLTKTHKNEFTAASSSAHQRLLNDSASSSANQFSSSDSASTASSTLLEEPTGSVTIQSMRPKLGASRFVNVPRQNEDFFGRKGELDQIHALLNSGPHENRNNDNDINNSQPVSCILSGNGGVGKTQTASQYVHMHAKLYEWIFWVRAETEAELMKSYFDIGRQASVLGDQDSPGTTVMEKVQTWLERSDQRWMLVFDNVDTWDKNTHNEDGTVETWHDITRFWPRSASRISSIIITTQRQGVDIPWTKNVVKLEPFDPATSTRFLLTRTRTDASKPSNREELANDIYQLIGGLPLYLNQAANFIQKTKYSLAEYIEELAQFSVLPQLSVADRTSTYEKPLNAAFDAALAGLDSEAQELVYILAFLNPEGVPETMLFSERRRTTSISSKQSDRNDLPLFKDENKSNLIGQLQDAQLVDRLLISEEYCLSMHRSLQLAIRNKLTLLDKSDETPGLRRKKFFNRALRLLKGVLPEASILQQPDEKTWKMIQKYLPSIQSLESSYRAEDQDGESAIDVAILFSQFGVDLYDKGLIKIGEKLMKTAERILETCKSSKDVSESTHLKIDEARASIHIVIGMYTDTLGITRRVEGLERREKALQLRRSLLSSKGMNRISIDDDILLHNAVMDLSCSHQQSNRFDEVERLSNQCFQKYRTWGNSSEYPYEYAKYYHSMAFVFVYRRQTELAVRFAKAASNLMTTAGGGTLLSTVYQFDYAICLFQDGDRKSAIEEQQRILQIRLDRCGQSNSLTLQSYLIIGIMYYMTKNFEAAESWLRQVLINHAKAYWPEENVARAKYYMSLVLKANDTQILQDPSNASLTSAYTDPKQQTTIDGLSRLGLAKLFFSEAEEVLNRLLPPEIRAGLVDGHLDSEDELTLCYDFMAPWGYRIKVQQTPNYLEDLKMLPLSIRD